ncbi:hypothetical protein AB1K70_19495 [Bremerella sp. JC770]|uniref:hypothetical protein n=1 Tax=Bremerella sp. JC770 TaxID=3232137 RepID=UPI00345A0402
MALVEINWHPTKRQLWQFGLICLFALPAVGWLWGANTTALAILAVSGVVIAASGVIFPQVLKPLFLALTIVTTPIGIVVGELAMLMIYFGVFLPLGLVFRCMKRDALQRELDRDRESYWEPKKQPTNIASYYRQS